MVLAQIPRRNNECPNKPAAEDSSSLQRRQAENFARMINIEAPINQYIKQLGAYDPCQYDGDTKIPSIRRLDALLGGVADADPEADQHASRDQDSVCWYGEVTELKESGEHWLLF